MKIIVTHEQADFDAMASLLGAHLLDDAAIPVLSRRMNRNVRAFLNLYGADLPFVEPKDLPAGPIDMVILVDTQSLISFKGMSPSTKVKVIDHHPLRQDLPADWDITVSGTGANTTIFIETLRERDVILDTVQSTLLLLGIYEDTGSLTYTRTTARDLRAASHLLEQGASLQIATDFLNHPLSQGQQDIYDQLRRSAQHYHIHGYTVIVATGDAQEMDEELSSVAHKLRDLLDPDALFVLITTRSGVQLIARSNSDNIDVSQIAQHFGGGGHDRAAASIIKNRSLDEVRNDLVEVVPKSVRPSITVAQIMSTGPQLLSPETPVEEIHLRMQRYGHEGYPVVQDGRVVGLVTRREVDRTMSLHLMDRTAEKLMSPGSHSVSTEDSIEILQRLMTDTGWGQVPVLLPETGEVVGIVTRTDLIKTLNTRARLPGWSKMTDRLERALPAARLEMLKAISDIAHEQHTALYIVGGFVRDLLLERPSLDFDLVVEGDAIDLARSLARAYGGRVTSHARFGTAKWFLTGQAEKANRAFRPLDFSAFLKDGHPDDLPDTLDLVSARTEFYTHPTALPTVERSSIKLDLHRRDFTINTLALRLDGRHYGELHDYWGGLEDLHQGLIRVLHSLSFVEDPTRILRAVRFEQRFGFQIEQRTLELLMDALGLLDKISGDRMRHEITYILEEEAAASILARLGDLNVLDAIHADLTWDDWLNERLGALKAGDLKPAWEAYIGSPTMQTKVNLSYLLLLLRLPPGHARSVSERLKLPAHLRRMVDQANQLWHALPELPVRNPSEITTRLDEVAPLALYAVYMANDRSDARQVIMNYVVTWRLIEPSISGHDLRMMSVTPGPAYKEILKALRDAWLDGRVTSTDEEARLLESLVAGERTQPENPKVKSQAP